MSNIAYADVAKTELAKYADIVGNKYETQLREWISNQFIAGYPDGNFKPQNPITRSEFMALVNRSYGFTATMDINYSDIKSTDWFYKDAAKATKAGFIQGAYGKLMPLNKISRQEVAVILAKLTKNDKVVPDTAIISSLADGKDVPAWSQAAISVAMKNKLFEGFIDKSFKPTENITRLEAVIALDRAFKSMYKGVYATKGTYGPETGMETLNGNVVVIAPDVTLRNTTINGDLILRETIGEGNVYLDNVVVKGETVVKGGGANSIVIKNSTLGKVVVIKEGNTVRIVATGTTEIGTVDVGANAELEEFELTGEGFNDVIVLDDIPEGANVVFEGNFGDVQIDSPNINVAVQSGTIDSLKLAEQATDTNLTLAEGSKVTTLTLDAAANVSGKGAIGKANINATGTTIEQKPAETVAAPGITISVGGETITAPQTPVPSAPPATGGGGGGGGGYTPPANAAPVASNVTITGGIFVTNTLTGNYTYSDTENNPEGTSTYKWYWASSATGTKTAIAGATSKTYTLQASDVGRYLFFEVTPKATTGTITGTAVMSTATARIEALHTDATLRDLKVGTATIAGFSPTTENYTVYLPTGTSVVPTVTAIVNDTGKASAVVRAATALPGATTVVVTAHDGTTKKTYTINFRVMAGKTSLQEAISEAESKVEAIYTAQSWSVLQSALTAAKAVNDNVAATAEEVANAITALINAIEGLVFYIADGTTTEFDKNAYQFDNEGKVEIVATTTYPEFSNLDSSIKTDTLVVFESLQTEANVRVLQGGELLGETVINENDAYFWLSDVIDADRAILASKSGRTDGFRFEITIPEENTSITPITITAKVAAALEDDFDVDNSSSWIKVLASDTAIFGLPHVAFEKIEDENDNLMINIGYGNREIALENQYTDILMHSQRAIEFELSLWSASEQQWKTLTNYELGAGESVFIADIINDANQTPDEYELLKDVVDKRIRIISVDGTMVDSNYKGGTIIQLEAGIWLEGRDVELMGDATLTATIGIDQDEYESDNVKEDATSITIDGTSQHHNIFELNDIDWVKFEAKAGETYEIKTSNLYPGAGSNYSMDTVIELYDSEMNMLDENDDTDEDIDDYLSSVIRWVAETDGTYYIKITHYSNSNYDQIMLRGLSNNKASKRTARMSILSNTIDEIGIDYPYELGEYDISVLENPIVNAITITPATGGAEVARGGALTESETILSSNYDADGLKTYVSLANNNGPVNFDTVFSSFSLSTKVGDGAYAGPYDMNGSYSVFQYGPQAGYSVTAGVDQTTKLAGTVKDTAPVGVYTITTEVQDGDEILASATYTLTVTSAPIPANAAVMENFNTHYGDNYKGVNVGWRLTDGLTFEDIEKLEVRLYAANDELLATNTATLAAHAALYETGERQFSTPFAFEPMTDEYWTFGDWEEDQAKKPVKAELVITGKVGEARTYVNESLADVEGMKWDSMFPVTYKNEEAAAYVVAENFNTHRGTNYQGLNAGFELKSLKASDLKSIEVSLYKEGSETPLVTNSAKMDMIKGLGDTVKDHSTPFIITAGDYVEEYWTLGSYAWKSTDKPSKAVITIVDKYNNTYIVENTSLSEATATFESLFYKNVVEIRSVANLISAIANQADGQTWIINTGTYDIPRDTTTLRNENGAVVQTGGQSGWYMPITANNLTIIGVGNPVLTSSTVVPNGAWASQNLITVWGDDVTLKGLTITPKVQANKSIEVVGDKKFTIENCTFAPNTIAEGAVANYGGSLYFNGRGVDGTKAILVKNNIFNYTTVAFDGVAGSDITITGNTFEHIGGYAIGNTYWGSAERKTTQYASVKVNGNNFNNVVDGTKIIAARLNQTFILDATNMINGTAIDKNDFGKYINFNNLAYWIECKNNKVFVDGVTYDSPYANISAYVTTPAQLVNAVTQAAEGDTILVAAGTYALNSQIRINKALTIIGAGDTTIITKGSTPWTNATGSKGYAPIITITSGDKAVKLENIKVTGAANITMSAPGSGTDYGSGINVVSSSNVTLNNITSMNNAAAGLIVNSSTVTANNLNTSGNGWYGVNVDQADSGPASFTLTGEGVIGENVQIISDKTEGAAVAAAGYIPYSLEGTKTMWSNRTLSNMVSISNAGGTKYYATIQAAVTAANTGDTIDIGTGNYAITGTINVTKPVTIKGAAGFSSVITTSADTPVFNISAAATLDGIYISKTNKIDQHLIKITANGVTIKDSKFVGQYQQGDNEVVRAIVPNAGITGYNFVGNHFEDVRQPAYLEGAGTVTNNFVKNTRGWVVCVNHVIAFSGNTFEGNAVDIAIIANNQTQSPNYTDIAAISEANNGAYVENQLTKVSAKNSKLVVEAGTNVNMNSFENALKAAQPGDTIDVAAGTYSANQFVILAAKPGLTIQGAGMDQTIFELTANYDGFKVQANNTTLRDFTITTTNVNGTNRANYGLRAQGIDGLAVDNVKITNMSKSAFDLNGVTNATLVGVTAEHNGYYGIAINQSKGVTVSGITLNNSWAVLVANKPQPSFNNQLTEAINIQNVVSTETARLVVENYISGVDITAGITFDTNTISTTPIAGPAADCTQTVYLSKDQQAADAVKLLIQALPEVGTIQLVDQAQIIAARTAYNGLTEAQKVLVTNIGALEAAEVELLAIGIVETEYPSRFYVLNADNNASGIVGYGAIVKFRDFKLKDVETLSMSACDSTNAILQTNTLAIAKLVAEAPTLDQLMTPFDVSGTFDYVADGYWIVSPTMHGNTTIPAYAKVNITLKTGKVITAEILLPSSVIDQPAADSVINLIQALPAAGTIRLADQAQIIAARTAFSKLTDAQKVLVTNIAMLNAAELELLAIGNVETNYPSRFYVLGLGDNTSGIDGYGAVVKFRDFTIADVISLSISACDETDRTLQTNTLIIGKLIAEAPTLDQIMTPFDVTGSFDYAADGYWVVGPSMHSTGDLPTYARVEITLITGKQINAKIMLMP